MRILYNDGEYTPCSIWNMIILANVSFAQDRLTPPSHTHTYAQHLENNHRAIFFHQFRNWLYQIGRKITKPYYPAAVPQGVLLYFCCDWTVQGRGSFQIKKSLQANKATPFSTYCCPFSVFPESGGGVGSRWNRNNNLGVNNPINRRAIFAFEGV